MSSAADRTCSSTDKLLLPDQTMDTLEIDWHPEKRRGEAGSTTIAREEPKVGASTRSSTERAPDRSRARHVRNSVKTRNQRRRRSGSC